MDKYEFSLKMEQMKKLIHQEDYFTALKIVEGVDWNRVRNTNLLTMAATVFERNDRLSEAKDILNMALDRAPVGKRILYKLTELAVRTGELEEAENYYYEFRQVDSEDIGNYVLQYMILKARHAPYDRQLQPLELYCEADPDEKWLYELATTYEFAGNIEACIRTCDRIALLYGDSQYSLKALRLKMRYAELTGEQKNMLYPRSVPDGHMQEDAFYQQSVGYGAYGESNGYTDTKAEDPYEVYGLTEEPDISSVSALSQEAPEEYVDNSAEMQNARRNSDALAAVRYENEDADFDAFVRDQEVRAAEQRAAEEARRMSEAREAAYRKAEAERAAAEQRAEEAAARRQAEREDGYAGGYDSNATIEELLNAADERDNAEAAVAAAGTNDTVSDIVADHDVNENASDEGAGDGEQMAFDFAGGEPRVVNGPADQADAGTGAAQPQMSGTIGAVADPETSVTGYETAKQDSLNAGALAAASGASGYAQAECIADNTVKGAGSTIAAVEAALNAGSRAVQTAAGELRAADMPQYARTAEKKFSSMDMMNGYPKARQSSQNVTMQQTFTQEAHTGSSPSPDKLHMIVEAETLEAGLGIAVEELKHIHEEYGIEHASSKTTAAKLNEIGFTDSILNKIRGRDFVIENAGDLDDDLIEDLYDFIMSDRSGIIVVMIDTPDGLDHIEDVRPELFDVCDYISDIDDDEYEEDASKKAGSRDSRSEAYEDYDGEDDVTDQEYEDEADNYELYDDEPEEDEPYEDEYGDYDDPDDDYEPERSKPQKRSNGNVKEKYSNIKSVSPAGSKEQMEIDDFAQYCTQYASEIDCSITGKSMLALYERIELMEEDGIPLTKENAEQLIEEAADRAEKPPIGKRLSGVFHSKYDKNGCLILKEDDFIF